MLKQIQFTIVIIFLFSCSNFFKKTIVSKREIPEICFGIRDKSIKLDVKLYHISKTDLELLRKNFSDNAISIANDIGVTEFLLEFISLGGKNKFTNKKLFIMKETQERISLSQMELSSMLASDVPNTVLRSDLTANVFVSLLVNISKLDASCIVLSLSQSTTANILLNSI